MPKFCFGDCVELRAVIVISKISRIPNPGMLGLATLDGTNFVMLQVPLDNTIYARYEKLC